MRRGQRPSLIHLDGVKGVVAVNLGADYCAEHEDGIRELNRTFGVTNRTDVYGIDRRRTNLIPKTLQWTKYSQKHYMSSVDIAEGRATEKGDVRLKFEGFLTDYVTPEFPNRTQKKPPTDELHANHPGLVTAWDWANFAAASCIPEQIAELREIFEAFKNYNGVFTFSNIGDNPFDRSGLCLAIADRLPESVLKVWYDHDVEAHQIEEEVKASGIRELLRLKGKGYFALSPKRTDGKLVFWLNPMEQKKNNCGYFTLEDLQDWAEGKGKIPMKQPVTA